MTFTDAELDFIAHCLSVASVVFHQDADHASPSRLAEQFIQQAEQAEDLRRKIDDRE